MQRGGDAAEVDRRVLVGELVAQPRPAHHLAGESLVQPPAGGEVGERRLMGRRHRLLGVGAGVQGDVDRRLHGDGERVQHHVLRVAVAP